MDEAPDTQALVERWVIDTCRDLKMPIESADDDFFAIGGNSLTLMRLIARAEQDFQIVLEPDELLEQSTVRGIAAVVRGRSLMGTL